MPLQNCNLKGEDKKLFSWVEGELTKVPLMLSIIFAFLFTTSAHAYMVISDVDDTVKITNSGSTTQAAWSGFFKKDVFPGMPEMYKAWSAEGAQLHFVTASPKLIRSKMLQLLSHHDIPVASLVLRGNLLESKLSFKVRAISKIMDEFPLEDVILVGDDVGKDPEVSVALRAKYGSRILVSYIRPVQARTALEGNIPYVTAFDIASEERALGRLDFLTMGRITLAVVTADKTKLFPRFAWCPQEIDDTGLPTDSSSELGAEKVETFIETLCRERQSDSENLH